MDIIDCLYRNSCTTKANKALRKAESKIIIYCICFVIIGLGVSATAAATSVSLQRFWNELMLYFECEESGELYCDRSDFEKFTNPTASTLSYTLAALYPVITLLFFF